MASFLLVAFFSLLTASVVLYTLDTARTLLGILPLIAYLATIAGGFWLGLRPLSLRNPWMIGSCGVVMSLGFLLLSVDRLLRSQPSLIFGTNAVVLFCLLMGLQFGAERLPFYSRRTTFQRRCLNGVWLAGITLSLLLYFVYGIQGDLSIARFLSKLR